ncbi:winged helix-turn-helix domain-containing protein [Lysobacter sp. Root494]|uniref:winged helix-turn-helix domain-containing protein n=1 Tax=Lysobacter sp. Root494 TaxID=1736549 RepID=UPI0006F99BE7|nr:winged helix-turn-helix domain-containing protein [Lysobacter sp. Root494]KQY54982.1 hypothetical protein ASD14_02140 [Lysobacter sp. Root494]
MASARHYRFGSFRLDTQTRELRDGDGPPIALTAKAFDTLCTLIAHRDRIVTKDELLEAVWAGRVVEENNLTQAVAALRRALGTNAGEHRYILTVPGHGYRFVAEVRDDAEAVPPAAQATRPARPGAIVFGAMLFALALAGVAAWQLRKPAPAPAHAQAAALAVLPFRPLSTGPRDELLELGMADTLITRISSSTHLRVRSLASSQQFAGLKQDPLEAGRDLGADYIVEGTIQRNGGRVRITSRLLSVRDGMALWSGTFDETPDRIFTLQDSIAESMTKALQLNANMRASRASPCDGADAEAYRAYLAGRYQLDRPSRSRMRASIAAFQRAIDRDPTCARAYAGMAYAYRALAITGDEAPRKAFPLAKAAVQRALAIDPELAEAHSSLGFIRFWYDWDWAGSEASFKRAIELNPSLAEARIGYAHLLYNIGRDDEAARQARQAMALDPLSPLINTLGSSFIAAAGQVEEARQALEKAFEVEPDFWVALLGRAIGKLQHKDSKGAIADLERARVLSENSSQILAVLGMAYARAGDRAAAEQILRDMEDLRARSGYMPGTSLAKVALALGDTEGAMDLLERAYEDRDIRLTFLQVDTAWEKLRSHPGFQALMERMHFPANPAAGRPATSQ